MVDDSEWQVGDRVFAPWEMQWLYPATILYIDRDEEIGDVAFIKFDDRDRGVLPLSALQSVAIRPGNLVFAKTRPESLRYLPAIVLGVSDDGLRVRFTDNNHEGVIPLHDCRLLNTLAEDDED
jgi:hypothetical protein